MNLLLISNSTNFGEPYLAWPLSQIELFFSRNHIPEDAKIVFIPFAGVNINGKVYPESYHQYEIRVQNVFSKIHYSNLNSVHQYKNQKEAIKNADVIIVGGGNTFHLVAELHRYDLMNTIREKVKSGTPYIGWSAGSNVACPGLFTTNDMPIVQPQSFETINLIPFQINPHYLDSTPEIDRMIKHGGETRQDRLNEYLAVNQNMKVVGLRESSALWISGNQMILKGGKKMILLQYNQENIEYEPESDISFLLQ